MIAFSGKLKIMNTMFIKIYVLNVYQYIKPADGPDQPITDCFKNSSLGLSLVEIRKLLPDNLRQYQEYFIPSRQYHYQASKS